MTMLYTNRKARFFGFVVAPFKYAYSTKSYSAPLFSTFCVALDSTKSNTPDDFVESHKRYEQTETVVFDFVESSAVSPFEHSSESSEFVVFPALRGSRFRRSHSPLCGVRFAYSTKSKNNADNTGFDGRRIQLCRKCVA